MDRFICVHAHFYQPPRENPWLESIELQDSAYPYHDWNERITAECYAPNMASRILDETGRIIEMVNIYGRISFNFGPTLLSWLEEQSPQVYGAILEADRESQTRFSGHGSALAQVYNHMIMPLASERDRITQVRWGIKDFQHRFGRDPEGMWLAETAVDIKTLETLAAEGIRFTILAPHQAARVRAMGERDWTEMEGAQIDPTRAYRIKLRSGAEMALFFYDGPISRAIAFENLLNQGENFAQRLLGGFTEDRNRPQLVHIATDGETYGHHHRFGDMGLSYALHFIETRNLARLTNYGEFLQKHPPTHEVEIVQDTSWSCAHGIERWRSDCSCSSGGHADWNQAWRAPLRKALDWLRDAVAPVWEERTGTWLSDPWAARNDYVEVILDRNDRQRLDRLLDRHKCGQTIQGEDRMRCLKLMELQRHAQLMYTSCGWFFDELSGIETVQILQYAGRVLQLADEVLDLHLEESFLARLERAGSNLPDQGDGRRIYGNAVKPAQVHLDQVAAHYAMTSLFQSYGQSAQVYSYTVDQEDFQILEAGKAKLVVGRARFTSRITGRTAQVCFGVLHLGDHNLTCGVRTFPGRELYACAAKEIFEAFSRADFPETIRRLDRCFGPATYSLKSLFRDEQRKILDTVLAATLNDAEAGFRRLFDSNAPLMRFLKETNVPLPNALYVTAEFILNLSLRQALETEDLSLETVVPLLDTAQLEEIPLDHATLEYTYRRTMEKLARRFHTAPEGLDDLLKVKQGADLLEHLPFEVNLWTVQNLFYEVLEKTHLGMQEMAANGDQDAQTWVDLFVAAGDKLKVRVL